MSTAAASREPRRRKYLFVAMLALRQRLGERAVLLGRAVFYVVILVVFWRLWQLLLRDGSQSDRAADYVWYLAVTEWILLAQPPLYLEIERDVRSGDLAYHLTRPTSYLALKLSGGLAEMLVGVALLLIPGVLTSYLLAGGLPSDPRGLALAFPLGLLSGCVLLAGNVLIGLSAFWLQDCTPLYWIYQKSMFVLGGLLVPLEFYPGWLRQLALLTPCSALINGPARMLLRFDLQSGAEVGCQLLAWAAIATALLLWVYRRALHCVDLHGG